MATKPRHRSSELRLMGHIEREFSSLTKAQRLRVVAFAESLAETMPETSEDNPNQLELLPVKADPSAPPTVGHGG